MVSPKRKNTRRRGFPVNASKLMEAIGKKGLSLEALAREADVDRSTIYHLQTGKNASPDVLKILCCCLGRQMEDLLLTPKDVQANQEEVEAIWDLIKKGM